MKAKQRFFGVIAVIFLGMFFTLFVSAGYNDGNAIFGSEPKVGDTIGTAVYSDVVAVINMNRIASFNIKGNTAICVEELADYGFDVTWNAASRALYLGSYHSEKYVRNKDVFCALSYLVGSAAHPVLYSDIKTFLNGKLIESFNIDGKTMIYIDSMQPYGSLSWNAEAKFITLTTTEHKPVDVIILENVGFFHGEVKNGKPHGKGTIIAKNGDTYYKGGFFEGNFEGYGEYTTVDGWFYTGEWVDSNMEGFGILYDPNNIERYWGDWKAGYRNGYGMEFDSYGNIHYSGNWKDNLYNGKGSIHNPDNEDLSLYDGDFVNGKYEGEGTLYDFKGNVIYKGRFSAGNIAA